MSGEERMNAVASAWEKNRADLLRFVRRLVISPDVAEDIVQQAAHRAIAAENSPPDETGLRRWLFRIASNLTIDELRRQGTWSETTLMEARGDAEGDASFADASEAMRATAEVAAIARQHLAFCFACTLRSLRPERAAALLLAEVYGFTVSETAAILSASHAQAKNWLHEARASLEARYAHTCALINKGGICYQCSELSAFFNGHHENPLEGSGVNLEDRVRVVRATDNQDLSAWHLLLARVVEQRAAANRDPDGRKI